MFLSIQQIIVLLPGKSPKAGKVNLVKWRQVGWPDRPHSEQPENNFGTWVGAIFNRSHIFHSHWLLTHSSRAATNLIIFFAKKGDKPNICLVFFLVFLSAILVTFGVTSSLQKPSGVTFYHKTYEFFGPLSSLLVVTGIPETKITVFCCLHLLR